MNKGYFLVIQLYNLRKIKNDKAMLCRFLWEVKDLRCVLRKVYKYSQHTQLVHHVLLKIRERERSLQPQTTKGAVYLL